MGLVYLPTFTIKINQLCRCIYYTWILWVYTTYLHYVYTTYFKMFKTVDVFFYCVFHIHKPEPGRRNLHEPQSETKNWRGFCFKTAQIHWEMLGSHPRIEIASTSQRVTPCSKGSTIRKSPKKTSILTPDSWLLEEEKLPCQPIAIHSGKLT